MDKFKVVIKSLMGLSDDVYEFKPVLCEIENSPVSPLGRFTFWTIVLLIIITIIGLFVAKIDIVVSASGIVIPDGEAKVIQNLETGVVKNILVKEGDFVKKGDILIEIDSSSTEAQLNSTNKDLEYKYLETQQIEATSKKINLNFDNSNSDFETMKELQKKINVESLSVLRAEILAQEHEIQNLILQLNSNKSKRRDLDFQLNLAKEKLKALSDVADIVAYNQILKAQEQVNNLIESVQQVDAEKQILLNQIEACKNNISKIESSFNLKNYLELSNLEKDVNNLISHKKVIEYSNKYQKIVAPCDGYIDKLNVHTVGGIVPVAHELIFLTPKDAPLLIKADVVNKDVGFVKTGMPVLIKIDAFDFQKYGTISGVVKTISKNSMKDEVLGSVYEVFIKPDKYYLEQNGSQQKISTGMTLNAEIQIGKRSVIEFFVYPLIKYFDEGLSVR